MQFDETFYYKGDVPTLTVALDRFGYLGKCIEIKRHADSKRRIKRHADSKRRNQQKQLNDCVYYTFHYPKPPQYCQSIMTIRVLSQFGKKSLIPYEFDHNKLKDILTLLKRVKSESDLLKTFLFIQCQFVDGTIIELDNGEKGCVDWEQSNRSALRYWLFKKDGIIGRKQRVLYIDTNYRIIQEDELIVNI